MAFGQIDPARLEGDDLRRWYMRSSADVEQERQQAAAREYHAFFSPDEADAETASQAVGWSGANPDPVVWTQVGANRWRGDAPALSPSGSSMGRRSPEAYQLAGTDPSDFWNDWTPCTSGQCHRGRLAPPSYDGHLPFPPTYSPRSGDGSGGVDRPAPEQSGDKHPQCEMQERRDRGICAQQPTESAKAECNASATERRVWCDSHDGEIGSPDLFTARRKNGRRWP